MSTLTKKSSDTASASRPEDTEKMLLERLGKTANQDEYFRWMLFTVGYYRGVNKLDAAKGLLQRFLGVASNPDYHVQCQLALGQIATDEQNMEAAIGHFGAALNLRPSSKRIEYILRNNLGYCLNMTGRFIEGEQNCRTALDLNWSRSSAYRNLGISFHGQGKLASAAWALVESVKLDASDDRARTLLKKLVADHPSLLIQCPWIAEATDPAGLGPKQDTLSG